VEFFSRNYVEAGRRYAELADHDLLGGGRESTYGAVDFRSAIARLKIQTGDKTKANNLLLQVVDDARHKLERAPADSVALYRLSAAEAMLGRVNDSLLHLKEAINSGWIDYRSPALDPRFDSISQTPQFKSVFSDLAAKVAQLGRQSLAASTAK